MKPPVARSTRVGQGSSVAMAVTWPRMRGSTKPRMMVTNMIASARTTTG